MSSDVVLSAAMRSNLLSLQSTSNSIDVSQTRLSTGRKINSALDGPQAFFASKALTNRAADLTKLLDSVGQSIQIIKAADNGITALTSLVEQADSIATQAQEALASGTAEAKATGNKDMRGIDDLSTVTGWSAGANLVLSATDEDGKLIDFDAGTGGHQDVQINISAGVSTNELITAINEIRDPSDSSPVFEASLDDKGQISIRNLTGGNFSVTFATTADTDAADLALANSLGFGDLARSAGDQGTAGNTTVGFSAVADVALRSFNFVDTSTATDQVANRSTLLTNLRKDTDPNGTALFAANDTADKYLISINGKGEQQINLNGATVQSFIDDINNNATLNTQIRAEFDDATGQVSIRSISANVSSIQIGVVGDATNGAQANFGFGVTADLATADDDKVLENIQLGSAAGQLAKLEGDFNKIREQMTQLVENGDTGYRGTNLLNGDTLLTVFNAERTSTIETTGAKFTADGMGIEKADFSRADTVTDAMNQVREALTAVREFGSTLANDLSVIQTRQTFTTNLINTLKEGSDKLVNADQNEEGAKLLALQTRQSLGVTALSLASQSQQSILRLF